MKSTASSNFHKNIKSETVEYHRLAFMFLSFSFLKQWLTVLVDTFERTYKVCQFLEFICTFF